MQIGIIGGGPVGSIAGLALKLIGHSVRLFDPTTQKPKMLARTRRKQRCRYSRTVGVDPKAGQDLVENTGEREGLARKPMSANAPDRGHSRFGRAICPKSMNSTGYSLGKSLIWPNRWQ